jgi:serine/threonine protein kinase
MVLEFCPGGELFYHLHRLGRLNEEQARFYFAEITLAMEYLHTEGIIYRDLKPENILIDYYGHVKLADFGTSREVNKLERRFTYCGSAEYMSPEMIQKAGHSTSIDCFSLGSLLYELLTGSPPFYDEDLDVMFWKIQNEPLQIPKFLTPEAKDLLVRLLDKDPNSRLGSEFISDIKDHPWCADIHWKRVFKKKVDPPFRPEYRKSNFDPNFTIIPLDLPSLQMEIVKVDENDRFFEFDMDEVSNEGESVDVLMDTDEFSTAFLVKNQGEDDINAHQGKSGISPTVYIDRKGSFNGFDRRNSATETIKNKEDLLESVGKPGMSKMKLQLLKKFQK